MKALNDDLMRLMVRELEGFKREIGLFPDDESAWRTVPGITNSAANLAMHVAGGLQHFVGTLLGKTGYVRNRALEFNRRSGLRAEPARRTASVDRSAAFPRWSTFMRRRPADTAVRTTPIRNQPDSGRDLPRRTHGRSPGANERTPEIAGVARGAGTS